MRAHIEELVGGALQALADDCIPSQRLPKHAPVERTRSRVHGDFATNAALVLAKAAGMRPRELAERLITTLPASELVAKTEIAGPGFVNFFLAPKAYHRELENILQNGDQYGRSTFGADRKFVVEFVSANPTGPLHVGHGRAAAVGDCLCRLLEATGWEVTREFYYNDAGRQITNLALSVQARCRGVEPDQPAWPDDGYRGDYIKDIARAYLAGESVHADDRDITAKADPDNLDSIREFAVTYLRREQDLDLRAFRVNFDVYSLESALYTTGKVEATVERLIANGHTYAHDNALWLKTTDYGDDKDRVMRKSDGNYTYFLPDVAYHVDKWERGFKHAVNEHGADHHSTVVRVRAGLQALDMDIPRNWPEYVLHQMVTVTRGGTEVKISKRAGGYVTLRDLIDEVGCDATRFFFVLRASEQHLDFDLDLAKSQSNDNPVYYIQYAHARIVSVFRQLAETGLRWDQAIGKRHLECLRSPHEDALLVKLSRFPETIETAATSRSPHQVAHYLRELANDFHTYYNAETFLVEDSALRNARLSLIQATRQVIKNGLNLLGVIAPDSM